MRCCRELSPGTGKTPGHPRRDEINARLDLINDATALIEQARALTEEAIAGLPDEPHYKAYLLQHFDTLLGSGNPYDSSLPKLADSLENPEGGVR